MKKWGFLVAVMLLCGFASNCFAVEVEGDAYLGVYSKYLWRGYDLSDGKPVLQGGMDLGAYGFTLGVWSNLQMEDGSDGEPESGEINETDFTIDYSFAPAENVSVSLGNLHYTYNGPDSDNELYAGLAFDVFLSPELYAYYAWGVDDDSGMDGLYYTLAVSHEFEPTSAVVVGVGALVGYNQENPLVGDYSDFHNYELSANVDYALTDNWSLNVALLFSDALSSRAEDEGVEDELVGSFNVTFAY